jgi:hypothetical protein
MSLLDRAGGTMMRRKAFLCWLLTYVAIAAQAQIDPGRNSSGVYFDEGALTYCTETSVGGQVTAYYCLTRITAPSGISFWEATMEVSSSGTILAYALRGSAVNAKTAPEFVVSLSTPLPYQSSLVVLEMTVGVNDIHPIGLRARPAAEPTIPNSPFPLPVYAPGDDPTDYRTVGYSFGWDPETGIPRWCAVINPIGGCPADPLATDATSWGGIKSLYR